MDEIVFSPIQPEHFDQLSAWLDSNAIPDRNDSSWVALLNKEPIAFITIRMNIRHTPFLEFVVKPSERRNGVGSRLVSYVLERPETNAFRNLHAFISFDNTAAQKILQRHGFSQIGVNENGELEYERH